MALSGHTDSRMLLDVRQLWIQSDTLNWWEENSSRHWGWSKEWTWILSFNSKVDQYIQGRRKGGAWRGHCPTCPFIRGATGTDVPLYKSIIGKFMAYQDRIETNLLQLFAHPETSEMVFYNFFFF